MIVEETLKEIAAPPGVELRESLGNASHPNASQGQLGRNESAASCFVKLAWKLSGLRVKMVPRRCLDFRPGTACRGVAFRIAVILPRWPSSFRPLREDVEPECRCAVGEELQCFLMAPR